MKNYIKTLSLFVLTACFFACENNSDLGFNPSPEKGWVQYLESDPTVLTAFQGATSDLELDVNIQVPTTSEDLTIFYDMVSVSGANPNTVFSNNGQTIAPAGLTSYSGPDNNTGIEYAYLNKITFDLNQANNADLGGVPMVFDVVLTETSSNTITAGLAGESFPVSRRIVINPGLDDFVGVYSVSEQFTAGQNAPLGLGDFFVENYQVELARVEDDPTASKFTVTNSAGFDSYFIDGAELTFQPDGTLFFDDGNSPDGFPVVGLFQIFEYATSSYDYGTNVLQADGPLGGFGDYQFILTKQ